MIPEQLTPDQLERVMGLADLEPAESLVLRMVCAHGEEISQIAAVTHWPEPDVRALYDLALAKVARFLIGARDEYDYWHEILECMRLGRSNPASPPIIVDRYNSTPKQLAYKAGVLRSPYPSGHDFVHYPNHKHAGYDPLGY